MKLLHTSDWHLGRSLAGHPLLDDQVRVLESLAEVVRAERVDVVVVAGDVYDRQLPAVDAVRALDHLLRAFRDAGALVVAIAGNHDSAVRLAFAAELLATAGVTLRGDPATAGTPVVVPATDGGPDLVIHPVPYLEPELARHALGVPDTRDHAGVLRVAVERARTELAARGRCRSVLVAHAFVTGGEGSESERTLAMGGAAEVPLSGFDGFDYVALGHLHGRQSFAGGRVRYSGSPLAYSFSERHHVKSAWLVDLAPTGERSVEAVTLPVPRPLAVVAGLFDDLLRSPAHVDAEGSFMHAVVTDPVLPRDAMVRLRARFRHAVSLVHEPPRVTSEPRDFAARVRGRSESELVADFLDHVRGVGPDADEARELADVLLVTAAVP